MPFYKILTRQSNGKEEGVGLYLIVLLRSVRKQASKTCTRMLRTL